MRLLGWSLIQFDRHLYQKRTFGHTERHQEDSMVFSHGEKTMRGHGKKGAIEAGCQWLTPVILATQEAEDHS
jgi:hypothetical protein